MLASVVALLCCSLLSSNPVLGAAAEFSRGQTTEMVGSNSITVDNNVKFVNYTAGEVLTVTLEFSSTCNIVFSGLTLRTPRPFTPPRFVNGSISNVTGAPSPGVPGTAGSVTFDIQFDKLKPTGMMMNMGMMRDFAMAHLNLVLGVDEDCNPATGDAHGVDGSATIGVQISVLTAPHP
jgi:hypothetical protein